MPAETLLDRRRTDWFPEFLSHGQMTPHFQPIVDLDTGAAFGREALMRGKLGAVEVRGGELLAAAEAHDALFSFDARARAAALEVGMPLMPEGEVLFVNLDPRACLDVESSVRTTWPVVGRLGTDPGRICIEIVRPERCPDRSCSASMVEAHRKRGALVSLDDLSGGGDSLACLELLRPDVAKIDRALTAGIQHSPAAARSWRRSSSTPTSTAARSWPRASSASTSSRRCASSASTSARATTSASRPSARWRSTPPRAQGPELV